MKFRVWVEVMTVTRMNEDEIEARMSETFDAMRDDIANGGWEVVER